MDVVLVGAGSLWPVHRISPCQKSTHAVRFAVRVMLVTTMVAMSSMHRCLLKTSPHPTEAHLHRQIRIIIVAPEAHFHEPFFASLDLDVRNIFAESHPEQRWQCSNHLASHLQNRSLSLSLYRSFACNFGR
jgi:hypothetical protein